MSLDLAKMNLSPRKWSSRLASVSISLKPRARQTLADASDRSLFEEAFCILRMVVRHSLTIFVWRSLHLAKDCKPFNISTSSAVSRWFLRILTKDAKMYGVHFLRPEKLSLSWYSEDVMNAKD